MKFVAILVFMYFFLGFITGIAVMEETGRNGSRAESSSIERPPLELPLELLLLAILLGLPVLGYRRARKQGEFMRFGPRTWLVLPPSLLVAGFGAGILAF